MRRLPKHSTPIRPHKRLRMANNWTVEPQNRQIDRNEYDFGNYRLQPRQFDRTQQQLGNTGEFNHTIFDK